MFDRLRAGLHAMTAPRAHATPRRRVSAEEARFAIQQHIRASYDSVARTPENARHWQWVDYRSADSSLNPQVRENIRAMARYECQENNAYGKGIALTIANDMVGRGPRLQMHLENDKQNQAIEEAFGHWAQAIDLRQKLTTMRVAKLIDGECLARLINNVNNGEPVSLDLQLIEADQLRSPRHANEITETYVDGVHLDRFGSPIAYDILDHHPGNDYWTAVDHFKYQTYPLAQVIHLFRHDRPGQHRGISELAPSLPLFALLRRFTLATVTAAETAANVSQVVQTDAPIPEELEDEWNVSSFEMWHEAIPTDRNSATVLPNQWKLMQFAAEHPATTYKMFKEELISEISRCVCMPKAIATTDSTESNYSSRKFDELGYERFIEIDRESFERSILNRLFADWMLEASLVGELPARVANQVLRLHEEYGRGMASRLAHSWYWEQFKDADEEKNARAQRTMLQNGTTHRTREYKAQGLDVEIEDQKAAASFGLTVEEYRSLLTMSLFTNGNQVLGLTENQQQQQQQPAQGSDDADQASNEESDSETETANA